MPEAKEDCSGIWTFVIVLSLTFLLFGGVGYGYSCRQRRVQSLQVDDAEQVHVLTHKNPLLSHSELRAKEIQNKIPKCRNRPCFSVPKRYLDNHPERAIVFTHLNGALPAPKKPIPDTPPTSILGYPAMPRTHQKECADQPNCPAAFGRSLMC